MNAHERRIMARLLALAEGRLTKVSPGEQQHVAGLVSQEHWGICNSRYWRSGCGPTCIQYRATLDEVRAVLAEAMEMAPRQLELREAS